MKIHYPILLYSVDDVVIYEGGNKIRAKQKFKLSVTIIGICFLLHGIPVFAAESSEMIEFDLKTNEM